jgi:hypothetical protein
VSPSIWLSSPTPYPLPPTPAPTPITPTPITPTPTPTPNQVSQRTWSGGPQTSLSSGVWLHLGFAAVFVGVGAILNASNSVFANRGCPHGRPNPNPNPNPKPTPTPTPTLTPTPTPTLPLPLAFHQVPARAGGAHQHLHGAHVDGDGCANRRPPTNVLPSTSYHRPPTTDLRPPTSDLLPPTSYLLLPTTTYHLPLTTGVLMGTFVLDEAWPEVPLNS